MYVCTLETLHVCISKPHLTFIILEHIPSHKQNSYPFLVPAEVRRRQVSFFVVVVQQVIVDWFCLVFPQQLVDERLFQALLSFRWNVNAKLEFEQSP